MFWFYSLCESCSIIIIIIIIVIIIIIIIIIIVIIIIIIIIVIIIIIICVVSMPCFWIYSFSWRNFFFVTTSWLIRLSSFNGNWTAIVFPVSRLEKNDRVKIIPNLKWILPWGSSVRMFTMFFFLLLLLGRQSLFLLNVVLLAKKLIICIYHT